jgi:hypothetical protein
MRFCEFVFEHDCVNERFTDIDYTFVMMFFSFFIVTIVCFSSTSSMHESAATLIN